MIAWAVETLIASTLLMLLVLVVRRPLREALGPRLAYWLWALPLLRMVLPPLPGNRQWSALFAPFLSEAGGHDVAMGVMATDTLPPDIAAHAPLTLTVPGDISASVLGPTDMPGGAPILTLIVALWALGAIGFLVWHVLRHRHFCRAMVAQSRHERILAQGRVRMIETNAATGPLAFGLWRKYVAFPGDFSERYDAQERDLALAHELGHHLRGDLYANWAALIVLACHWFNPIAWRAFRAFRADQEMACDALVLAGRAGSLRHAYGRAIVKSAHGGAVSAACHLHTINDVKGRLKMLARTKGVSRRRMAMGGAGMAVLAMAGLGLTASGSSAAENLRTSVNSMTTTESHPGEEPIAPVAPAAPVAPVPAVQAEAAPQSVEPPLAPQAPAVPDNDLEGAMADMRASMEDMKAGLKDIPRTEERDCGAGTQAVETTRENGKVVRILVCRDRIARIASEAGAAKVQAMQHKKVALAAAMQGLVAARASLAENDALSAKTRAEAVAGIDSGIADLRRQQASED